MRVTNEDLALLSTSLEESLASTQAELTKQKNLNEKLENDLVSVNKHHHGEAGPSVPEKVVGPLGGTGGLSGLDFGKGAAVRPTIFSSSLPRCPLKVEPDLGIFSCLFCFVSTGERTLITHPLLSTHSRYFHPSYRYVAARSVPSEER
ncbi:hypothetical protein BDY24DRAFT_142521 [Mrakia frigida]|uniref:uncharacterized protein n=1 Tax=Mrakia frigida TaxID=29902 RepID=UPI003FCC2356